MKKISVIIPSYNHKSFVEAAIASAVAQEHEGFELETIVIDDGSSDGSVELLRELHSSGKYPFELVTKANEGLCRTLNRAIREHSTGDLVAVLASDDMWTPDKLRVQVEILSQNPQAELCFSNAQTFGKEGQAGNSSAFLFSGRVLRPLTIYNFIPAGTMLFTRALFDRIGGFDETGLKLEDWDFLLRAAAVTQFCNSPRNLLLYRVHDESSLERMRRAGTLYDEKMKVLAKNREITNPVLRMISSVLHFALDRVYRPLRYRMQERRA
ncbi:glycosyltransferase family 2 protein [Aliihoeflea sp. PC F10.4]